MNKLTIIIFSFLVSLFFFGCNTDFDANGEYKEQMAVYCILDKNADTTFVRIEKCFWGSANAMTYAQNKDSIYYNDGELEVKLYAYSYNDTINAKKTYDFSYIIKSKNDGDFYSGNDVPLYYCITKNQLQEHQFYKLKILNKKTGLEVWASTYMVEDFSLQADNLLFKSNNNYSTHLYDIKELKWTGYNNSSSPEVCRAKYFQMKLVFNYGKNNSTELDSVSIPVLTRSFTGFTPRENNSSITIYDIVKQIADKLQGENKIRLPYIRNFVFYLYGANKDMTDYISINNSLQNTLNYKPMYSNIHNGFGLFASANTETKVIDMQGVDPNLWTELNHYVEIGQ